MEATLTELEGQPREVVLRGIQRGEEIILTDSGKPVAKIVPYLSIKVFEDPDLVRRGALRDSAINDAIRQNREECMEHLGA